MADGQIATARSLLVLPDMTRWVLILSIAACTHPEPRPTYVEFEAHGEIIDPAVAPVIVPAPVPTRAIPTKYQPPHVKLKLGHYRNDHYNISVTIELLSAATYSVTDIDPARVRFDGDSKIWLLEGRHGSNGRID